MWAENQHAFGERLRAFGTRRIVGVRLAAGPSGDRVLQVVEYLDIDLVVGHAGDFEQLAETVIHIVLIGQFQDRFVDLLAQPQHGRADKTFRPQAASDQPRRADTGQLRGGAFVDHDFHVLVLLQAGGRNQQLAFAFDQLLDDVRFFFAPRDQDDAFGVEDRSQSHRDRLVRYVVDAVEDRCGGLAAFVAEGDQPRPRIGVGARFVEPDLPLYAGTEHHQVDAVVLLDQRFVVAAERFDFVLRQRPVRDMDVLGFDVDVIKQTLVHRVIAALQLLRRDREEFVEAEYDYVVKTEPLFFMQFDQRAEQAHRRFPGRHAQYAHLSGRLFLADAAGDLPSHVHGSARFVLVNVRVDFFEFSDDVGRICPRLQPSLFRQFVISFHSLLIL